MKINRKLIVLMLVLQICASLAGCGEKAPDSGSVTEQESAYTINGTDYSVELCNIYYVNSYYEFASYYGQTYCLYYGLDITQGIGSLKEQTCEYSSDGTWYGFFLTSSLNDLESTVALCDYAKTNGIELTAEELEEIDAEMSALEEQGGQNGYDSLSDYLSNYFGNGVTVDLYRSFMTDNVLASKAYNSYVDSLEYTDEEISEHFQELGYDEETYDYRLTAMRHILVMAEADANGEYTEEAINAAHEKAVEIFNEWKSGECTEESFAELANTYSDDGGSNTAGGLYEDIYNGRMVEGINAWLFDAKRSVGDTAIIDNNGNYVGTHVVYFAGYGENYKDMISKNDLLNTSLTLWYEDLTANYVTEEGAQYAQIGVIGS